jgi:ribokinase
MRVLTVGSSVIDVFVTPDDPTKFEFNHDLVSFHLGDKIPISIERMSLGGNGANVSVALKRLDIDSIFYTYSGNDILSRQIEESIEKEGVELIREEYKGHSDVSLIFNFEDDRTIFSHHERINHSFTYQTDQQINYIYLTSIGREWTEAYAKVLDFAKARDIPVAFSPGSQQMKDMSETFDNTVAASRMLLMNKEEAQTILDHFGMEENIMENILRKMKSWGAHIVSITDGENGAYAIDGFNNIYKISPLPVDGHDKTGAGDSYAGAFLAGILSGKETSEAMKWGMLNAFSVMSRHGAQPGLLTPDALNMLLSEHTDLEVEKIT